MADHTAVAPKFDIAGLPPGLAMYHLAIGHYFSRALFVVAKLGVADLLKAGPQKADEIAAVAGVDAPSLRRLLRLLASAGVFEETADGSFALQPLGETLCSDAPGSMRAMVELFAGAVFDAWGDLEYCIQTGAPAYRKRSPESDPFSELGMDSNAAANFDKAMATFAPQTAAALCAAYDFAAFEKLADIGGGNGALMSGILRANPELLGLVFDLPHVVERAREQLRHANLESRCEVIAGSFFDAAPVGASAYLLKHVIHDWNDDKAAIILRNCRAALPVGGKVLIVEGIYPPRIDQSLASRSAAANDVNMLVNTGGRQRSEAEFVRLLAASGLRLERIVPTAVRVAIIEATAN